MGEAGVVCEEYGIGHETNSVGHNDNLKMVV
jgi:hypothetical protein